MISQQETMKRFQFIENITKTETDFREQVLSTFLTIFGYKKSVFWYSNEDGSLLSNPITLNISSKEMADYVGSYRQKDPIFKDPIRFSQNNVFCYSDFISPNKSKDTEFFEFMQVNDNQDIISLCMNNGHKRTGVISFLRSFDEDGFTFDDKVRLEFLSNYISNLLWNFRSRSLRDHIQIVEEYANLLSIGVVVIEDSLAIRYYNKKALTLCKNFTPNQKNPIEEIISQIPPSDLTILESSSGIKHPCIPNLTLKLERLNMTGYYTVFLLVENSPFIDFTTTFFNKLTQREQEVASLLIRGLTNKEISNQLIISINTVKRHIGHIYRKLGVNNKTELCYLVNSVTQS